MLNELLERIAQLGFWNYYYRSYLRLNPEMIKIDSEIIIKSKI